MKQKFSYDDLTELQALPLDAKIKRAERLIAYELDFAKKANLACSFDKASMVLLHMLLPYRISVCFHNTGVQYPQTYRYRDRILSNWNVPDYHETKPSISFWQCVKRFGYLVLAMR